jgi:ankyrin repeat protein
MNTGASNPFLSLELAKTLFSGVLFERDNIERHKRLKELSQAGLNLDFCHEAGLTPLHIGIEFDDAQMIRALVEAGPNQLSSRAIDGMTPLHGAVYFDYPDVVEALVEGHLKHNVAIDDKVEGKSALLMAILNNKANATLALLKAYANKMIRIDGLDVGQLSVIHYGAFIGNEKIMKALIETAEKTQSDLNAAGRDGFNALYMTIVKGHKECALMIIEALVRQNQSVNTIIPGKGTLADIAEHAGYKDLAEVIRNPASLIVSVH